MKTFMIITSILFYTSVYSQSVHTYIETGDADIDLHLDQINNYGRGEFEFFKNDMSLKFGVSKGILDDYYHRDKISPANIYLAYTLSSVSGKPVGNIFELYKEKKGWGEIAKELGIKPGSREFHIMKGKTLSGIGKVKSKHIDSRKGGTSKGSAKGRK